MFFYFRRIHVHNIDRVPKNKPVLLLSNHQNALLDALLIATRSNRFAFFLTRAGVFKKEFVSKLLKSLQMLPVYRVRDGWSTITKNNEIFETCSKLLHEKNMVIIFPEGSHNLARRVRVLSKGFTRIVFDTLEAYPETDLQLVPIGLNFKNAKVYPDETSMYYGKPIAAKEFFKGSKNENILSLKLEIQNKLKELTTHIPVENYDEDLKQLESRNVNFLKPTQVNNCLKTNFKDCKPVSLSKINWLRKLFKLLLIINVFPPYLVWKFIAEPKVKELEFLSTFRFAIAITLVPIYLIITTIVLGALMTPIIALYYFMFVILISLLTVKL